MHVTILAKGSRGDVKSYAMLSGLKAAEYQTRIITFESFRSIVAERAQDFHPMPDIAQALVANGRADTFRLVWSFTKLA
jgi:hypothetical protein